MATVNLVPGTQHLIVAQQRRRALFAVSVVLIVILAAIWGTLAIWKNAAQKSVDEAQARLDSLQTHLVETQGVANRIVLFEQRLQAMNTLLTNHLSWDPFFQQLEQLLPANAYLEQFNADSTTGMVKVVAHVPALDDIAQTVASLKNSATHQTLFTNMYIDSFEQHALLTNGAQSGNDYIVTLSFRFDPKKLSGQVTP